MSNRTMSAGTAAQKSTTDEANNVNPQLQQCNVTGSFCLGSLEEVRSKLEDYLLTKGFTDFKLSVEVGKIPYYKIDAWLQYQLNSLCITNASFVLVNGKLVIKEYKYLSYTGEPSRGELFSFDLLDVNHGVEIDNINKVYINVL